MNCDTFLSDLETGDSEAKLQARRHAASCSRCATVLVNFEQAKIELATHAALPAESRRIWESVAGFEPPRPQSRRVSRGVSRWIPWSVGITAAACVLVVAFISARRDGDVKVGSVPKVQKSVIGGSNDSTKAFPLDTSEPFSRLALDVENLEQELSLIRNQAERLDAQRQLTALFGQFEKW